MRSESGDVDGIWQARLPVSIPEARRGSLRLRPFHLAAGYDSRHPYSLDQAIDPMTSLLSPVTDWKIGYGRDIVIFRVEPEVILVTDQAVAVLSNACVHVEEVKVAPAVSRSSPRRFRRVGGKCHS